MVASAANQRGGAGKTTTADALQNAGSIGGVIPAHRRPVLGICAAAEGCAAFIAEFFKGSVKHDSKKA